MPSASTVLAALSLMLVVACDSSGDGNGEADCDGDERYMELATGKSWTFAVTNVSKGTVQTKTQTVGPLEDVGGSKGTLQAFRVTTEKTGGTVVSWQQDTGSSILRHRERDEAGGTMVDEIYDAHKLRFDESPARLVVGSSYTETYDELVTDLATSMTSTTPKTETWTVEALDDIVTVGAGTFCALRIQRTSMAITGGSSKTYWFARGVGKIREDNGARIEELTSFVP